MNVDPFYAHGQNKVHATSSARVPIQLTFLSGRIRNLIGNR